MIKNILIRRKESDTYLATVSRHRWSSWITMKNDEIFHHNPQHRWSSWITMKNDEIFHHNPRTPTMSTDSSQVGVALFPSYKY